MGISPLYLLPGLGMMVVGLLSVIYWKARKGVAMWWFLFGGMVWASAIAAKVAMDLTVSNTILRWLAERYGAAGLAIIWGLVVGLRTGYLECGFTYFACIKSKLGKVDFPGAVAFGIGFGAAEAIVIGFFSFLNVLALIMVPGLIGLLPPQVAQQLSLGPAIIPAPIIERSFTLLAHVFSAVLIIYAVRTRRAEYFLASFFYKSSIDGLIPWLNQNLGTATLVGIYSIELIVVLYGTLGLFGTTFLKRRFGEQIGPGLTFRRAGVILLLSSALAFVVVLGL